MKYSQCPVTGCPIVTDDTYSFRAMGNPPKNYVVHNQTGCTLPYNNGKAPEDPNPFYYKSECFAEWYAMTRKKRKQLWKEWREKMYMDLTQDHPSQTTTVTTNQIGQSYRSNFLKSLDCYKAAINQQEKVKENSMNTLNIVAHAAQSTDRTPEDRTKDYLSGRLRDLKAQRKTVLMADFGISDMPAPKTPSEMVERLKAGKYVVENSDELDDSDYGEFYYSPWRYIKWRDPEVKKDTEGYEKALKALSKLYTDTYDDIVVGDGEKGLAALRQFESTTFH